MRDSSDRKTAEAQTEAELTEDERERGGRSSDRKRRRFESNEKLKCGRGPVGSKV